MWDNNKDKYQKKINEYVTLKLQDENTMKLNNFRMRYECYAKALKKSLTKEENHKKKATVIKKPMQSNDVVQQLI